MGNMSSDYRDLEITPPVGLKIQIDHESGFHKLTIPQPSGGVMKYLWTAFTILWLCGWAAMGLIAGMEVKGGTPSLIFYFLLVFWTSGGIVGILTLYGLLRPPISETLILSKPYLLYDSGFTPLIPLRWWWIAMYPGGYRLRREVWQRTFRKRVKAKFDQAELKTLELIELWGENRLTLNRGNKRLEIGFGASKQAKKWLFELIQKEYGIQCEARKVDLPSEIYLKG